ncbi:MAG: glycosyltransferase family 4 protein [Pyrinomonadaceae bacterium]|jgi:glycosyltransferase involved in cell wall biosynthesis|nr:glycosyltransferase family 4 protein [Pyrinomonadaceae bacterium]
MRVLIDGQTLLTPEINRGIGTYFMNVTENILENDFTNEYYINVMHARQLERLPRWSREMLNVIVNETYDPQLCHGSRREYHSERYSEQLNEDLTSRGIDVYWSPNALMDNVFLPSRKANCKFAVTIYDLIVLIMEDAYTTDQGPDLIRRLKSKLKTLQRDYDLFLHISNSTKSDFTSNLDVADKTHAVTMLAARKSFHPNIFPETGVTQKYVLYIGGFDPRKNMRRAVEAFARLQNKHSQDSEIKNTRLLIVCHGDQAAKESLLHHAKSLGIEKNLILTGFVDDPGLLSLYQKARCFFFPSLYEGFGLPVLEALACGLPVTVANISSLTEVGGEFATYFDPYNVDEMADALYNVLQEPTDYASRMRRYEYSKKFSWQRTALEILRVFKNLATSMPEKLAEPRQTLDA